MSELTLRVRGEALTALTVELSWERTNHRADGLDLDLDGGDAAHLRWLLEDPTVDLYDAGQGRRRQADEAVVRIGKRLGSAFGATEEMRALVREATAPGQEAVVLIASESDAVLSLPWELTRLGSGRQLSNVVDGFARQRENVASQLVRGMQRSGPLRVLLVVSRPAAEDDVEYQAIAAKLLDRLESRGAEIKLVRPGTFQALERELSREAYDLVHYDGHGVAGSLAFEDGLIDAERLGRVLADSGVPIFALNACQSARGAEGPVEEAGAASSIADALVRTGAAGVVAMGASVRVVSAVAFFDRFYEELARGQRLTRACHQARNVIETSSGHGPLDWSVPILYVREDVAPFEGRESKTADVIEVLGGFGAASPAQPEATQRRGLFLGRDGDLYKVDRAVDEHVRVLVFGVGGVGKTTLMEYLLDWRRRTAGVDRVVEFSFRTGASLETLMQVLTQEVVATHPEAGAQLGAPQWQATPLHDRMQRVAQVLATDGEARRLLLLDNVETLGGYPTIEEGPYTAEDREDFQVLLDTLGNGDRCRVVLTARRDELELLGDRVRRFPLYGVRPRYRLAMLQSYAESFGVDGRLKGVIDDQDQQPVLEELLAVIGGHPLATRVAAYGLKDRTVKEVLESIRGQARQIEVPAAEKGTRSESLEQVLAGTLRHLLREQRRAIGVLGLFAGRFHESDLFTMVAHEQFPDEVLDDRTEAGLRTALTEASRLGLMAPNPTLAKVWDMVPGAQGALDRLWKEELEEEVAARVEHFFTRYWAATATQYSEAITSEGRADWAIHFAHVDEQNLRKALQLAGTVEAWGIAHPIIRILLLVWQLQGRVKDADHLRSAWVERVSDADGNPRDNKDGALVDVWRFLLGNLANRYMESMRLDDATMIHNKIVEALERNPETNAANLAVGYTQMGGIEQSRGQLDSAESWYHKSLEIVERLGDRLGMAATYHQLGMVEEFRGQLDAAESWYRRSLEIEEQVGNSPGMATSYHQLGMIEERRGRLDAAEAWYRKGLEIKQQLGNRSGMSKSYHQLGMVDERRGRLDASEAWYRKSLEIKEQLGNRPGMATSYHQLGMVEERRGRLDAAEAWYRKSLEIEEEIDNSPGMATSYFVLGRLHVRQERFEKALHFLLAAFVTRHKLGLPETNESLVALNTLYCLVGEERFKELWTEIEASPELQSQLLEVFSCEEADEGLEERK